MKMINIDKMTDHELAESSQKTMYEFLKFRRKYPPTHIISTNTNDLLIAMKEMIGRLT